MLDINFILGLQPIQTLETASSSAGTSDCVVNSSKLLDSPPFNDLGALCDPGKSIDEICQLVNLSVDEKFSLLFRHVAPPAIFPPTFSHGFQRRFNQSWLNKYPWLLYSPKLDGIFCGPCAILLPVLERKDKGMLVNRPFSNWIKISSILANHSSLHYHRNCLAMADTLKLSVENPSTRVDVMFSDSIQKKITENEHILRQIVRAILYLGKQGLPFRGNAEKVSLSSNPGNFLALLKFFAETDPVLSNHLYHPQAKNATYISPQSQNDIINVIGYDIILAGIVHEIKASKFFSVIADEVSSHGVEHLTICLRFVDDHCEIREEFIGFVKLKRVRAIDITEAIINSIENLGLSLCNLRGQGYDGASTMSGERGGVQAKILEKQPKALYTHCAGHSLNLAILKSCSIPSIRNCIDEIKAFTWWVKVSHKRAGLLKAVVDSQVQTTSRVPLLNTCITRWVENIEGWERFSLAHPFLIKMCEVILYGDSNFPLYSDGSWTAEDKKNALAHMKALECFEFVFCLITLQRSLFYLKEGAVKIQATDNDIVSGVTTVMESCADLKKLRENVEDYSQRIFKNQI